MQKKFLTTDEITHGFGIDAATVQALVDSGDLKALADRGTWKYRREDVEALIKSGQLHPTKELPVVEDLGLDESFGFASEAAMPAAADFLELDEDALSEQPTIIRSESALDDDAVGDHDSSSDVHIVFEPTGGMFSDSDIRLAGAELAVPKPSEQSGDGSDSDVRTAPSSGEVAFDASKTEEIRLDQLDDSDALDVADRKADDGVGSLETLSDLPTDWKDSAAREAFVKPDSDSDVTLKRESDSDVTLKRDSDSDVTLKDDSGIALVAEDSGITLDADDSGITVDAGDSGISPDVGDSGISLELGDSGISLEAGDSGIKLQDFAPTLREKIDPLAATENQMDFRMADEEQPPRLDTADQTAIMSSMDDSQETFAGSVSGGIAAHGEVEDLEVSPELDDELIAEEDEFESAELADEIHEAGDEDFSEEFGATGDEEELAAGAGKAAKSYEPSWGAATFALALSAALLIGLNMWLAWAGVATMWDGSDPAGPAASLVTTIGGLM